MFSNSLKFSCIKELDSFSVKSVWRENIETCENGAQTDSVKTTDSSTQRSSSSHIGVSANPEPKPECDISSNSAHILRLIQNSSELIIREIAESIEFSKNVIPFISGSQTHFEDEICLDRVLNPKYMASLLENTGLTNQLVVSGVEWNFSQTSLVITFKHRLHTDWCVHKSFLTIWNLFYVHKSNDQPSYVLQVDGCITAIQAHPALSTIYAVGLFSGKIVILDSKSLDSDVEINDDSIVSSSADYDLSQDSIVALEWLRKREAVTDYQNLLISFSQDGLIVKWKFEFKNDALEVLEVFSILLADLPRSLAASDSSLPLVGVALRSVAFEPEDQSHFVVGCEGGAIFLCSLNGSRRSNGRTFSSRRKPAKVQERNPIVMSYAPHRARVKCIYFSKSLRNVFLSTGLDQELRIWNLLQSKPLHVLHNDCNLTTAVWSFRVNRIVGVEENGYVCVFKIEENTKPKLIRRFTLEEKKLASCLWLNKHNNQNRIAVSDTNNQVYLYELKW